MAYTVSVKPLSEREALIAARVKSSFDFGELIYDFRSGTHSPKVISLPTDVPVYRLENCRTFSAQQTEIARNGLDKGFFERGQELTSAQQAQHAILLRLAEKEKEGTVAQIIEVLRKEGQRETILITSTGVVVNGNRRLSAMRELMRHRDGSVDERFTNVRCAVLPPDVTRDEIDDIEADLQARPQTKLDYDWIGDARLIRRQVDKGRSTKEVADRLRRSKTDIENALQALDEADLYLSEWVEKPREYDLVQDGQQIFGDIPKSIAKKDLNLQNASRAIAWIIYDNRDKITGRVYRLNAAFGKLATNVLKTIEDQLEVPHANEDSGESDDFAMEIESDVDSRDYSAMFQMFRDESTKDDAISVLIEACETAIELDKGQRNEQAALRTLAQVNAKVMGVDVNSAGKSTLQAMLKQVETIRDVLQKIEAAIKIRQNRSSSGTDYQGEAE